MAAEIKLQYTTTVCTEPHNNEQLIEIEGVSTVFWLYFGIGDRETDIEG